MLEKVISLSIFYYIIIELNILLKLEVARAILILINTLR